MEKAKTAKADMGSLSTKTGPTLVLKTFHSDKDASELWTFRDVLGHYGTILDNFEDFVAS